MNKQALSLAVFVAGAYPAVSNALSLGDIESNSNLNQPLKAKIELLSTNVQEAQQLKVRLAPPSVFNRVGIDRPSYLNNLRFQPTIQNGKPIILVSSSAPIQEPFVNFLVEVSWPQGQLLKEYTVMLDPPVLMQAGSTMANEAAVRAEPQATGQVARAQQQQQAQAAQQQRLLQQQRDQQARAAQQQRQAQQQEQARQRQLQAQQRAQQQAQAAQQRAAQQPRRSTYRVRSGDTLYKVAARMKPSGVSTDQMMMALYRSNPNAFINNNINGLKKGAVLRAPSLDNLRQNTTAQAKRQVRQQYEDWKNFRSKVANRTTPQRAANNAQQASSNRSGNRDDDKKLEVLGANNKPTAASQAAAAAGKARLQELEKQLLLARESLNARQRENEELKSRVTQLESIVETKNKIITIRDRDLARIEQQLKNQKELTDQVKQQGTPSSPPTSSSGLVNGVQQAANGLGNNMQAAINGAGDIANEVANQPNDTIQRNQPEVVSEPKINIPPPEPLEPETTEENITPSSPFADDQEQGSDLLSMLTSPMALKIAGGSLAFLVLLGLLSRFLGRRRKNKQTDIMDEGAVFDEAYYDDKPTGSEMFANLEDDIKRAEQKEDELIHDNSAWGDDGGLAKHEPEKSTTAEGEEDDVLMESEVYIAYGLHQQAETELTKAIEKHPERLEYRHKLLQNHFAANNRESFDRVAEDFLKANGENKSGFWKDIVTWGRKISPDNPIYDEDVVGEKKNSSLGMGALAAGAAAVAATGAAAMAATSDAADNVVEGTSNALGAAGDGIQGAIDDVANLGNDLDMPDLDLGAPDLDLDLAKADIDLNTPDLDLDLPKAGIDLDTPDLDLDLPKGDLDLSMPDLGLDTPEAPNLDLDLPDTPDLDMPDLDSDLGVASLGLSGADDLDLDLSGSDDLNLDLPGTDDLDLDMPDLDLGSDFDAALGDLDQNDDLSALDLDGNLSNTTSDLDLDLDLPTETGISNDLDTELDGLDFDVDALNKELEGSAKSEVDTQIDTLNGLDFDGLLAGEDTTENTSLLDKAGDALGQAKDVVVDTTTDAVDAVGNTANHAMDVMGDAANSVADAGKSTIDKAADVLTPDLDEPSDFDLTNLLDDEPSDNNSGTLAAAAAGLAGAGAIAAGVAATTKDKAKEAATDVANLDLHVRGSEINKILPEENLYSGKDEQLTEDEWLGDIDDALSFLDLPDEEIDLHEAHISTKLDLARAYLDMGDIEGARSTLEEVMVEGNDDQRREAETLLHQTG